MSLSSYRPTFDLAFDASLRYLADLEQAAVAESRTLEQLRSALDHPLLDASLPPEDVIRDLIHDTKGGIIGSAGGRFYGWAIGGSLPAALAADWLTSVWDQNAGLYSTAPAAAVIEEVAGAWLKQLLHLPARASFAFVSGCQMAHVTCLAAARNKILADRHWDVEKNGLAASPPIRILASNRHGSIARAVRLLGLGENHVEDLPLDAGEQLQPATLEAAFQQAPEAPTILILQAGNLNTGTFDPFEELISLARRHSAWVHIDGAFGLWAAASSVYREQLRGFENADSWATDGHKWLNVPYDCGYAFVADAAAHQAAWSLHASYLVHAEDARDQINWNPEWSRRARGFATYAAIRQLGTAGVADLINRCCELAVALVQQLGQLSGVEVLWQPTLNQGLVRFLDPRPAPSAADHDRYTDFIVEKIRQHGGAFFTATSWRGRRAMRISVLNWQTNRSDIERSVAAVEECLRLSR